MAGAPKQQADNAEMRSFIVHLHRLLVPDSTAVPI